MNNDDGPFSLHIEVILMLKTPTSAQSTLLKKPIPAIDVTIVDPDDDDGIFYIANEYFSKVVGTIAE